MKKKIHSNLGQTFTVGVYNRTPKLMETIWGEFLWEIVSFKNDYVH